METDIETILAERGKKYGDFADVAEVYCEITKILHSQGEFASPAITAALDMIAMKLARIVCGNPEYVDNWDDIAGYATLAAKALRDRRR